MKLDFVPLLALQRDLYRLPRGPERFRAYLRTMIDDRGDDLRLPLVALNPMGKDHVATFLDSLLAFDADAVGAAACAEAEQRLRHIDGEYKVCFVVADDVGSGWTNRAASEYSHRFGSAGYYLRGWIVGLLWTADAPTARAAREELLTSIYRLAYVKEHGEPTTLRERMAQEGWAMAQAGCTEPTLDSDDLEYSREVIAPFLDAEDMRTSIECLYGDALGRTLGFTPRGLSARAGLALARHEAARPSRARSAAE